MENIEVIEKLQQIVNIQFDKILKINYEGRPIKIAIRRDQIPQLVEFKVESRKILISFSNSIQIISNSQDFKLLIGETGEIKCICIPELNKLKSESFLIKLNTEFCAYMKKIPEMNITQIIYKNKQKRMCHAISEIIKTVPNIVYF